MLARLLISTVLHREQLSILYYLEAFFPANSKSPVIIAKCRPENRSYKLPVGQTPGFDELEV